MTSRALKTGYLAIALLLVPARARCSGMHDNRIDPAPVPARSDAVTANAGSGISCAAG